MSTTTATALAPASLTSLRDTLRDHPLAPFDTARTAFDTTRLMLELSNLISHHLAVCAAELDRLGAAAGGKTKAVVIEMGMAPAVADRVLRVGRALPGLALLPGYAADGVFPLEHLDAIISGLHHVQQRAPDGLCDEETRAIESTLIAHAAAGFTPTEITDKARHLGNHYAAATGGLPAAEDRSINELTWAKTVDGRIQIRGNLDIVTGEKLLTALDSLSTKRPEPDGTPDARSTGHRHTDALDQILDAAAANTSPFVTRPNTHVNVVIPADNPDLSYLQTNGPITAATAALLACDAGISALLVDNNTVPLQMGDETRYFPPHLRRAIIIRDQSCIKCGAPARWGHIHHRIYWSADGPTDLDNGCLLCPSCHAEVHATGWDIILGADRHPWLIPPETTDPHRQPLPAYHRRTMTLDDRTAA